MLVRHDRGTSSTGAASGANYLADERVGERFAAPGDDVERFMYGFSLLVCLTNSLAESPSVGTGTVMRPDMMRAYAVEAGFEPVSELPVEHGTFRFYRLDP